MWKHSLTEIFAKSVFDGINCVEIEPFIKFSHQTMLKAYEEKLCV